MASKEGNYKQVTTDEPQELESLDVSSNGDELEVAVSSQVSKRLLGKMGVVLTVVGLIGSAMMIMSGYHTPQQKTVPLGFAELNQLPSPKVGLPDGGDQNPDMSNSLNPPKLCDKAVVKSVCSELKSDTTKAAVDELGVMEIAEALALDEVPAFTFLGSLGLVGLHAHVTVNCQKLCESLVASIPEYRRPPGHDVGGRLAFGKIVWDIDLSSEALASIQIPDKPADPEGSKLDPDRTDLPLQGRLLTEDAEKTIAADAADILANLFRVFPRPAQEDRVAKMVAAAPAEPAVNPCAPASTKPLDPCATVPRRLGKQGDEEAIYGNGKEYTGRQSKTRSGKTCVAWSSFNGFPAQKNYCRNTDGSETIWCFTSTSGSWAYCDPIGAPLMYGEAVEKARIVAKAWLTKTLREFSGEKLPDAYEKWMGPSQTVATNGLTKKGCVCQKEWTYGGKAVKDYCGNPDQDAGGRWCLVRSDQKSCQGGVDWGYCFPSTTKSSKPCGPGCQGVHKKLVATAALLDQLTFKYDAEEAEGTYAYVIVDDATTKEKIPVKEAKVIQSSYRGNGKVLFTISTGSNEIKGRKVIYMCKGWYNLCKDKLESCSRKGYGTTVGTVIHEAMHHFPVDFNDYLYYRGVTSSWVAANKNSNEATRVVKNAADPMEYFVSDNNGYKTTGR